MKMENREKENSMDAIDLYMEEMKKISYPILTPEEERDLIYKIKKGDLNAKKMFLERNLSLVVSIAKQYVNKGLSFLDLVQEGNLGLMNALEHFDIARECKFSVYATPCIYHQIQNALKKQKNYCQHELLRKYEKIEDLLEKKWNRKPTDQELTLELDIQEEEILLLKMLNKKEEQSIESTHLELDDILQYIDDLEESIEKKELQERVQNLLKEIHLNETQREILQLLYGFDGKKRMNLTEVGKIYGVKKQNIFSKNQTILKKFRSMVGLETLIDYTNNPNEARQRLYIRK